MNTNLRKYALDLAEDYLIFKLESGWRSGEEMSPEAYVRAKLKNMQDEFLRHTVDHIQGMIQSREVDV